MCRTALENLLCEPRYRPVYVTLARSEKGALFLLRNKTVSDFVPSIVTICWGQMWDTLMKDRLMHCSKGGSADSYSVGRSALWGIASSKLSQMPACKKASDKCTPQI
jgi:hypothetical protein